MISHDEKRHALCAGIIFITGSGCFHSIILIFFSF